MNAFFFFLLFCVIFLSFSLVFYLFIFFFFLRSVQHSSWSFYAPDLPFLPHSHIFFSWPCYLCIQDRVELCVFFACDISLWVCCMWCVDCMWYAVCDVPLFVFYVWLVLQWINCSDMFCLFFFICMWHIAGLLEVISLSVCLLCAIVCRLYFWVSFVCDIYYCLSVLLTLCIIVWWPKVHHLLHVIFNCVRECTNGNKKLILILPDSFNPVQYQWFVKLLD